MTEKTSIFKGVQENFAPGLVVFLVALPLCLGIALASGAPPLSGVIAGIIGGIVIGSLSNSHISVSGPAAGLAAIVFTAISDFGAIAGPEKAFQLFLMAGLLAGAMQFLLGIFKAGSISNYFPSNVIEGMLVGIGIIILLKQIPHALGYDKEDMSSQVLFDHAKWDHNHIAASIGAFFDNLSTYFTALFNSVHLGVILITVISLVILLLFMHVSFLKKIKVLPGALVAVIFGIIINEIFKATGSSLAVSAEHLVKLPVASSADDYLAMITLPDFSGIAMPEVWVVGATIAIVASIETLLCIEASDRMDEKRRLTNTNNELRAQGIGNVISSLIGGLPITSVIVRSSANANSGATSKASAIIHGILLLISVLAIPFILNKIPLATLAAILLVIGYKLASPAKFKKFFKLGWYQFLPFIITVVAIVFTDLLKGVGFGMIISFIFILVGNMKRSYFVSTDELEEGDEVKIDLAEEVSFLNKAAIKRTLQNVKPNSKITIDASNSQYIAYDVLELIQEFANVHAKDDDIEVSLVGFKTDYSNVQADHPHVVVEHHRAM